MAQPQLRTNRETELAAIARLNAKHPEPVALAPIDGPAFEFVPAEPEVQREIAEHIALAISNPDAEPPLDIVAPYIVNVLAYRASVPAEIPWAIRRIAYLGGVSLIAGPPKVGKSTLVSTLIGCRETGQLFLGWEVVPGPTLLVTEEGGVAVAYKTEGLSELDILDRRTAVSAGLTFAKVLEVITEWAGQHPGGLAIIDTLSIWAGITDENDAAVVTRAIAAISHVAQACNIAIVLVHHSRKSGGDDGEGIRGSGAILATVDLGIELSRVRPGEDDRYLDTMGRVILPERFRLSFDRDSKSYALADDQDADQLAAIEADLARIPSDGPGLSRQELQILWMRDPRKRSDELLNKGRMRKEYVRVGRTLAFRYWSIPAVWTAPND